MRRRLPNANQQLEEGVSSVPCPAPGGASLGRASEEKDSLTQHVGDSCQKEVSLKNIIKKKKEGWKSKQANTAYTENVLALNTVCEVTPLWNKDLLTEGTEAGLGCTSRRQQHKPSELQLRGEGRSLHRHSGLCGRLHTFADPPLYSTTQSEEIS